MYLDIPEENLIKQCPACDARWLAGQLYWATGKPGCPHDLAGLLCNDVDDERCINPCRGSTSGTTWEQRRQFLDKLNGKD
jgi:hypothetical protein|tara:strand:- start:73 stop:312 length:240 start_codon:yes stop_codon:yes gene_type:complete